LPAKTRHTNHVELVEVRAENRKEFEPLEQRVSIVERFVQNPGVELEPAQLAIDEERRVAGHDAITR
jgi:hypothetical protein